MSNRPSSPARSTTSSVASYSSPTRSMLAKMTPASQAVYSVVPARGSSPAGRLAAGRATPPPRGTSSRGGSPSSVASRSSVGGSEVPRSRPQALNTSRITGVTPPSSRGGSPARSHSPGSREGRMLALVKDFQQLSLRPWGRRVEGLEKQMTKSLFLDKKDTIFLEAAKSRNISFMRNVEAIMEEAVGEDSGIESGIVRHSYAAWTESNTLNHRIEALLGRSTSSANDTFRRSMAGPSPVSSLPGGAIVAGRSGSGSRHGRGISPASERQPLGTSRTQSPSAMSSVSNLSDYTRRRSSPLRKPVALPQATSLQDVTPMPNKHSASPLTLVRNGRGAQDSSPVRQGTRLATVHSQQRANIGSSPSRLADRTGSPARMSTPTNGSTTTTAGGRSPSNVSTPPPRGRTPTAAMPRTVGAKQLTHNERRAMLEGIEGLSKRSSLTAADLTWAQSVFMRLYGAVDGPKQFNTWFDEQALRAVKSSP